ncbi:ChuX/HutX family heme-like substrate-binding protein [Methylopila musalis]|uniref:ChuX/HutX family heme-like substrate-binding protein n=1 Tax=Methylopila musalis TaxID=1134781 RepID=A0ABW3Z9R3_9HYPH
MSQPCRGGGCPNRRFNERDTLLAEPGVFATRIGASFERVARDLRGMDGLVTVTSNPVAVMTQIGGLPQASRAGERFAGPKSGAALRLRPESVAAALAVERAACGRAPCSVRFFTPEGGALHKVFLPSLIDDYAFAELTVDWGAAEDVGAAETAVRDARAPDAACWSRRGLGFHLDSLFGDGGLRRRTLLPAWGRDEAWRIDPELAVQCLGLMNEARAPVTIIVPNEAFAQMHVGALDDVRRAGDRLRLCAGDCSVSLDMAEVDEVWVTRHDERGRAGLTVEFYDWGFQCVAQITETGDDPRLARFWRRSVEALPPLRA